MESLLYGIIMIEHDFGSFTSRDIIILIKEFKLKKRSVKHYFASFKYEVFELSLWAKILYQEWRKVRAFQERHWYAKKLLITEIHGTFWQKWNLLLESVQSCDSDPWLTASLNFGGVFDSQSIIQSSIFKLHWLHQRWSLSFEYIL